MCLLTSGNDADGEVAWSCRPDAGGKFVMMLRITRATMANEHWFTEESAYKP
jgi:hypothetical protein